MNAGIVRRGSSRRSRLQAKRLLLQHVRAGAFILGTLAVGLVAGCGWTMTAELEVIGPNQAAPIDRLDGENVESEEFPGDHTVDVEVTGRQDHDDQIDLGDPGSDHPGLAVEPRGPHPDPTCELCPVAGYPEPPRTVRCNDGNDCTRGECIDGCCYYTKLTGTLCYDDDWCTQDDYCVRGVCHGGTLIDCDDGNVCTIDYCSDGECLHAPENMIPCHDGTDPGPCREKRCYDGECQTFLRPAGTGCEDDGNACTYDRCDGDGNCTHPPRGDGTPCDDDGNLCTQDFCQGGSCSHPPVYCSDANLCTEDSCDPALGCQHEAIVCDDNNNCTTDSCHFMNGCQFTPNSLECDDGDSCTTNDVCSYGVCVGTLIRDCDDQNVCTDDDCVGDGCVHSYNTKPCDDGSRCTGNDICSQGYCSGTAIDCTQDPGVDACSTNIRCETAVGSVWDWACDDGDLCTNDSCNRGSCTNTPIDCEDFECDDPGTPNTGETEILGQLESSLVLYVSSTGEPMPAETDMPVLHRIVTHDTPRGRDLHGMLSLSRVSGDASVVDLLYLDEAYTLDSPIPVVETGHGGCGDHDWHFGVATFTVIPRKVGEVILKAQVDPDSECCEGNGVPTVEAQVTIEVLPFTVTLKEITFGDEHTMYEEALPCDGSLCWGAGALVTGPDWQDENNPDHPVGYTRSTGMRLVVKMEVEGVGGGDATLRVVGPEGVAGEGTFGVPSGTEERWVTLVTGPLPDVVKAYTPASLSWSARPPGVEEFGSVGMTSHRVYVTLGTPTGSEPTNRRMNMLCNAAWQAATPLEVIDGIDPEGESGGMGIQERLDADPPLDGKAEPPNEIQADDWRLMSGFPFYGECHDQVHLMNLGIMLIGAPPGREYLLRASTDALVEEVEECTSAQLGVTEDLDGDGQVGEEVLGLYFDFFNPEEPPLSNLNAFEGILEMAGQHYSVWPSFRASSGCHLLLQLLQPQPEVDWHGANQYWMLIDGDNVLYVHLPAVPGPTSCP